MSPAANDNKSQRPKIHWASGTKPSSSKEEGSAPSSVPASKQDASAPAVSNEIQPTPSVDAHAQGSSQNPTPAYPQPAVPAVVPMSRSSQVSAGPQHRPHGGVGLAIGVVGGLLFGIIPLIFLPGVGYVIAKDISRKKHSIKMYDHSGRLVRVKLWKSGKSAPLTEEGFRLVATDYRSEQMVIFLERVLLSMGLQCINQAALYHFIGSQQLRLRTMPLNAVITEVRSTPGLVAGLTSVF